MAQEKVKTEWNKTVFKDRKGNKHMMSHIH